MQVNTKEILLHPPPKGLANCALFNTLYRKIRAFIF